MQNFIVSGTVPNQTITPGNTIKEQVLSFCSNLYKYLNHVLLLGTVERRISVAQLNTPSVYTVFVCGKEFYSRTSAVKLAGANTCGPVSKVLLTNYHLQIKCIVFQKCLVNRLFALSCDNS